MKRPQPSPLVFDSIRREVASIMAPLGFPFEWRPLDSPPDSEGARQLAVITFRGNCSPAKKKPPAIPSGPGYLALPSGRGICPAFRPYLLRPLVTGYRLGIPT